MSAKTTTTRYGPWVFDREWLTLTHDHRGYEVDLERCLTPAQTLDRLCQVAGKTWCSPEDAGHLLQAVNDLLCPQSRLCSFGRDGSVAPSEIRSLLLGNELDVLAERRIDARRRADAGAGLVAISVCDLRDEFTAARRQIEAEMGATS